MATTTRTFSSREDGTLRTSERSAFDALVEITEALDDQANNRGAVVTATVDRDNGIGGEWHYEVRIDHETDVTTYAFTE
jgi:hypothetical protein